jgi:putative membrane protein
VNAVAQVCAGVAVLVHLVAFTWEVLLFERPGVHQGIFKIPTANLPATRLWSFNVGFYNLFLAAGPMAGLVLLHSGHADAGRWLVLYCCAFMLLAGIALGVSDLRGLSRPRGAGRGGALAQALPPLGALVAALF